MAIFAIGSDATAIHAPKAAAAGCVVIDNSSLYRMDPDVPLTVPEENPDAIDGYTKRNIIANPNCSTAQMVDALKPLHARSQEHTSEIQSLMRRPHAAFCLIKNTQN